MGKNIALVLPTIREKHCLEFLEAWDFGVQNVIVYVIEDNPERTFEIPDSDDVVHLSWKTIRQELGDKEWIIPRRTAAIRSFGYLMAYRDGADVILTLDDDCLPMGYPDSNDTKQLFAKDHVSMLSKSFPKWVDTIACHDMQGRGIPYGDKGETPTMINMGGWANVPDIDAPTTLTSWYPGKDYAMRLHKPVPQGVYFPLCAMNVGFRRDATVLMYQLLMSKTPEGADWPFVRFDDIWGGIIAKKLCDKLGWAVTAGRPEVWHSRASNVWTNLRLESKGMEVNEGFWKVIDEMAIDAKDPLTAYVQLASQMVSAFCEVYPDYSNYWRDLAKAMRIWVEEVDNCG